MLMSACLAVATAGGGRCCEHPNEASTEGSSVNGGFPVGECPAHADVRAVLAWMAGCEGAGFASALGLATPRASP